METNEAADSRSAETQQRSVHTAAISKCLGGEGFSLKATYHGSAVGGREGAVPGPLDWESGGTPNHSARPDPDKGDRERALVTHRLKARQSANKRVLFNHAAFPNVS